MAKLTFLRRVPLAVRVLVALAAAPLVASAQPRPGDPAAPTATAPPSAAPGPSVVPTAPPVAPPVVSRGTISGSITDAVSKKALADVIVEVSGATVQVATTDAAGNYSLPNLAPGTYKIRVTNNGYTSFSGSATLNGGDTFRLDASLAPLVPPPAPPPPAPTLPLVAPLLPGPLAALKIDPPAARFPTEPWADDDISGRRRIAFGDFGVSLNAEYRANGLVINPVSLNTSTLRNASWIEQRLRLDLAADWQDRVRIFVSADVLDGTLWGDNGDFGGDPSSNAGIGAAAKNPNVTRPCVALASDRDPLQATSYGYTLCDQESVRIRKLFTQINTPIGAFRVGRQSIIAGAGIQANDGEGRTNRFGFSRTGNTVDRILFATKPLEAFKAKDKRNLSESEGLILAVGYDRLVTDSPQLWSDDVGQWFTGLIYLQPDHPLGKDLVATAVHVYRWNPANGTSVNAFGLRAFSKLKANFSAGFDLVYNFGSTREVAEAYKLLTNDPVVDQAVGQVGARAVVRYDLPWLSAYLEFDYASGDPDPNTRTPLTQFAFAEDSNVGLLLFEHVLAYQTARASAAGVEVLRRLGAKSLPPEVVNSRGAFTNAVALFPQVDVRPHPDLLLRGGVLFAWAESPVIDPVASLQARDGLTINDDLVNYVGGPSIGRNYYGTELDARIQYRLYDHATFDLEGAILFPGDALRNKQGEAARSGMVQGRVTAFF